jgi:AcrR family transcriptional regulator
MSLTQSQLLYQKHIGPLKVNGMDFQRARTEEQIASRQEEIISACSAIYEEQGYEAVNFKSISERTTFTRPSIYNYYSTKEEVFLDLMKRSYSDWGDELEKGFSGQVMSRKEFCRFLTDTLEHRERMLELLGVHLNVIEVNSSLEKLTEFKMTYKHVSEIMAAGIEKTFSQTPEDLRRFFATAFACYMHGLYGFSHPTDKQIAAMKANNICGSVSFDELCYRGLLLLTSDL